MLTTWNFTTVHGLWNSQPWQLQTVPESHWFDVILLPKPFGSGRFPLPIVIGWPLWEKNSKVTYSHHPYIYIYIYELSFPINVSHSITMHEPEMAVWKWKPGTVANEKHSISEFDGIFCYSIWFKNRKKKTTFKIIYLQWNNKQNKTKIISILLIFASNKSISPVKVLRKKRQEIGFPSYIPGPDMIQLNLFSCLPLKIFFSPFLDCC